MIVGIDIGGTKTHLMAETAGGERRETVVQTEDWRGRTDAEKDAAALHALVGSLTGGEAEALVVGSHGCDTDEDCLALQDRLARRSAGVVLVLNDSELLLPAAGKTSGISVIAGTGSIAVGRTEQRLMIAAGGWGWYLGDEGSASGLVRDAARRVRLALDEGRPLDPLGHKLLARLNITAPVEMGRTLGDIGSAAGIGALAPLVFEAAEEGSVLAAEVVAEGGAALARLALRLKARGADAGEIVTGGGVVARQPRLFGAFRQALAEAAPASNLTLLKEPPAIGALVLARKLAAGERPAKLPLPHSSGRRETRADGRAA